MTQALNLGLLGNFVNTSGQVTLTTGVTGTLPVANGGSGAATLAANNVLLGNGTSALQTVAPGTNGNVLQSNGSTWISSTVPAPTTAGTLSAYAGASFGGVGTYVIGQINTTTSVTQGSNYSAGAGAQQVQVSTYLTSFTPTNSANTLSGTWKYLGKTVTGDPCGINYYSLFLRVA